MNTSEHSELIELVFDRIEKDPGMKGPFEILCNGYCIRLDTLDDVDTQKILVLCLHDKQTIFTIQYIIYRWAEIYSRYKMLQEVWSNYRTGVCNAEQGKKIIAKRESKKIQFDSAYSNKVMDFNEWFNRAETWDDKDRYGLVQDIMIFMADIQDTLEQHRLMHNQALQNNDVKQPEKQGAYPLWLHIGFENGWLQDNGNGKFINGCKSVEKLYVNLVEKMTDHYDGLGVGDARQKALDELPQFSRAVDLILKSTGKTYSTHAFITAKKKLN